ncbi:glycosyltransferase [Roseibium aestuarii]|uniref:Glycosyltransferase n=1 Tax=Roseibium aestuarii TaxID=2600299 RepID=A0ABW4JSS4_9HYPH|nr:glycosyltransferase [Roseibium aestuarii]
MTPAEYLVSQGILTEETVFSALAEACGLPFLPDRGFRPQSVEAKCIALGEESCGPVLIGVTRDQTIYAVAPPYDSFAEVLDLCRRRPDLAQWVRITTPAALGFAVNHLNSPEGDLESRFPQFSARRRFSSGQIGWAASLIGGLVLGATVPLSLLLVAGALVIAACSTLIGLARLASALAAGPGDLHFTLPAALLDRRVIWPRYTVLVPLFREAASVASLIAHLEALDYPREKLQILLLVEPDDPETLKHLPKRLPPQMRVLRVPWGSPRTKPRALAHGLEQATGDLLTIYDAEDRPEPDQLRQAALVFALSPPTVGCLQARLCADNAGESFFARHFALEYACLFDQLLPWLHRHDWPIPLGGTSNHFRTEALLASGAWDKFNVTEDADLGIRLSRRGYRSGVLASTTFEEAPITWRAWRRQRARWHKGWIQTFFVHTRDLRGTFKDLGLARLAVVLALIGGNMLVMALGPLCAILMSLYALGVLDLPLLDASWRGAFGWVCVASLVFCHAASAVALLLAARMRGLGVRLRDALTLPLYWLFNAQAFYQAVWEFARSPHGWNKTEHGVSRARRPTMTASAHGITQPGE